MALQQIFHVLRDTRNESAVLTHTLPQGKEEVRRILVLEQQIDLVNKDIGLSSLCLILGDTVQDTVKNYEHTDRHKRSAKLVNVIADKAALSVYVGLLCEGIKASVSEKFNRKSHISGFGLGLLQEHLAEVLKSRRYSYTTAENVITIYDTRATVDKRLFFRPYSSIHCLLTERKHKFGFESDGVCAVSIIAVHCKSIDMVLTHCGYRNRFRTEGFTDFKIFPLGIYDDNIRVLIGKIEIDNLLLCHNGFTRSRNTRDKRITVQKL